MQSLTLNARIRDVFGKKLKSFRKKGLVPAVLYGPGVGNMALAVGLKEAERIYKEAGENTIVKLKIKDDKSSERNVLICDAARDTLGGQLVHLDFLQVRMDQVIKAAVPLEFAGESPAVKNENGILVKNIHEIEVEALPADLPREITVDISSLATFEDVILIRDLLVPGPEGASSGKVKILAEPELVVAQVQPPRSEAELEALKEEVVEKVEEVKVEAEEKKAERKEEAEKEQ